MSGKFFGFVECDVSVPPHLHSKFGEMCPNFKNNDVSGDDMGEHINTFEVLTDHLKHLNGC